jgi:Ran GTPase-activating protein (RanGAP) involved in mRNA processing and transport
MKTARTNEQMIDAGAVMKYICAHHRDFNEINCVLLAEIMSMLMVNTLYSFDIRNCTNLSVSRIDILSRGIGSMKQLKILVLSAVELTTEGARALVPALKELSSSLEVLDLGSNDLGPEGVKALMPGLCELKGLLNLNVSSNDLGPDGMKALVPGLCELKGLQKLNVSSNAIGPDGMKALVPGLCELKGLQKLNVSSNAIGPDGASELAIAMTAFWNLQELRLGNNDLGSDGARYLANPIKRKASTLKVLCMRCNGMGNQGLAALTMAIRDLECLEMLCLKGNDLNTTPTFGFNDGVLSIIRAVQNQKTLKTLDISCNGLRLEGADAVVHAASIGELRHSLKNLDLRDNRIPIHEGQVLCRRYAKKFRLMTNRQYRAAAASPK